MGRRNKVGSLSLSHAPLPLTRVGQRGRPAAWRLAHGPATQGSAFLFSNLSAMSYCMNNIFEGYFFFGVYCKGVIGVFTSSDYMVSLWSTARV